MAKSSSKTKFRINRKLVAITVAVVVILTPTLFFWYRYQVNRLANGILTQHGERAYADGNLIRSRAYYSHHLRMRPNDTAARIRAAEILAELDASPNGQMRAAKEYSLVLAQEPERDDLKLKIAEALIPVDTDAALENANDVLEANADSQAAKWIRIKALHRKYMTRALTGEEEILELIQSFAEALEDDSSKELDGVHLAELYREHAKIVADQEGQSIREIEQRADSLVNTLGSSKDLKASAAALRLQYYIKYPDGQYPELLEQSDVRTIMDSDASDIEVLLLAAENRFDRDDMEAAKVCFEQAKQRSPGDDRPYLGLAKVANRLGNTNEGIRALNDGLEARKGGDSFSLLSALGRWQIQREDWDAAAKTIDRLQNAASKSDRNRSANRGAAAFYRARWLSADENPARNYLTAVEHFRIALANAPANPPAIHFDLGNCYYKLGHFDLAAAEFHSAWAQDRQWRSAVLEGEAFRLAGQFDKAAAAYRLAMSQDVPENVLEMLLFGRARVLLAQQAMLSHASRDWKEFDSALNRLGSESSATLAPLLQIESEIIKGTLNHKRDVKDRLAAFEDQHRDDLDSLSGLLDLHLRLGNAEDAERLIGIFEDRGQEQTLAARARLAMIRGHLLEVETSSSGDASDDQQLQQMRSAIELAIRRGDYSAAKLGLARFCDRFPQAIYPRFLLGQLAVDNFDRETLRQVREELAEIEGDQGTLASALAVSELLLAGDADSLKQADLLARELVSSRPIWGLAHSALGFVKQHQGSLDDALVNLERGFELGDRRPSVFATILLNQILLTRQSIAFELVQKQTDEYCADSQICRFAVPVLMHEGEFKRAEQIARIALAKSPSESELHLLLAQVLAMGGENSESVDLIDRATHISPENPAVWAASIALGMQLQETQVVANGLRRIQMLMNAYPQEATEQLYPFATGIALQMENRLPHAATYFVRASKASGPLAVTEWAFPLYGVSGFTLANPSENARSLEDLLRRSLVDEQPDPSSYSATFAYVKDEPTRLRYEALALLADPSEANRGLAKAKLIQVSDKTRGDQLVLAELARITGDQEQVLQHYAEAMRSSAPRAALMREYAGYAIRIKALDHARTVLDSLSVSRDLDLHVGCCLSSGDPQKAISLTQGALATAESLEEKIRLARILAKTFVDHDQELNPDEFIPASDKSRDAMTIRQWCDYETKSRLGVFPKAPQHTNAVLPLSVLTQLAYSVDADLSDARLVADMLRQSIATGNEFESELLVALSSLQERQGRIDEAFGSTAKALQSFPGSVTHRNNRVWIGSIYQKEEFGDMLNLINQVIRDAGPLDYIIDTKAMVLAQNGKHRQSARILYALAVPVDASPSIGLHYAHCCWQAGEHQTARVVFERTNSRLEHLVPFDVQIRQQMTQTMVATR